MIKSIAIEKTDKAFLPEAEAYRQYLRSEGYICDFVEKGSKEALKYDAILLFHGFHPFWRKYPKFIIGEYHSLSINKFNRLKDLFKRLVNVRADLYIFLNEDVRKKLWFSRSTHYIIRGMGFDEKLMNKNFPKKNFDIIYCGSLRDGVLSTAYKLANLGFTVALVGFEHKSQHSKIISFGKVKSNEALKLITQAKYGLNYTPNIFPYNIQDSTKVIEYCAAGLGVISNKYDWIESFEKKNNAKFLYLDNVSKYEDISGYDFKTPDVKHLCWSEILESSQLVEYLKRLS